MSDFILTGFILLILMAPILPFIIIKYEFSSPFPAFDQIDFFNGLDWGSFQELRIVRYLRRFSSGIVLQDKRLNTIVTFEGNGEKSRMWWAGKELSIVQDVDLGFNEDRQFFYSERNRIGKIEFKNQYRTNVLFDAFSLRVDVDQFSLSPRHLAIYEGGKLLAKAAYSRGIFGRLCIAAKNDLDDLRRGVIFFIVARYL